MAHRKFNKKNKRTNKNYQTQNENLQPNFDRSAKNFGKFNSKFKYRKIARIDTKEFDKNGRIRYGVNRKVTIAKKFESSFFNNETDGRFLFQQFAIKKGKKNYAEKIAKGVLDNLKKRYKNVNHAKSFTTLLRTYRIFVSFKSVKKAAMIHKVPIKLNKLKGMKKLVRLLISQARVNHGRTSLENLNEALFSLSYGKGNIFKKRLEIHKLGISGLPYLKFMKARNI